MNYWLLETEDWELVPDNYDGAETMTLRGRLQRLEMSFLLDYDRDETE